MNLLKIKDYDTENLSLVKKDKLFFVNYNSNVSPKIQLPKLTILSENIIPKQNDKYYKSDLDRSFIRMQIFNQDVEEFFQAFDDKISELYNKKGQTYFSNKKDNYYKLKLDIRDGEYKTLLFGVNNNLITYKTLDELSEYLTPDSIIHLQIFPSKVWTMNKSYGIHYKIYAIKIVEHAKPKPKQIITFFESSDEDF